MQEKATTTTVIPFRRIQVQCYWVCLRHWHLADEIDSTSTYPSLTLLCMSKQTRYLVAETDSSSAYPSLTLLGMSKQTLALGR